MASDGSGMGLNRRNYSPKTRLRGLEPTINRYNMNATMWNPDVETQQIDSYREQASTLLTRQLADVIRRSQFYAQKFQSAGVDASSVTGVSDLSLLPLSDKAEIMTSQDMEPPFGPHLAVPESEVAKVFQTSGSTGSPALLTVTTRDLDMWMTIGARSYTAAGIGRTASVLTNLGAGPFVVGHTHAMLEMMGSRVVPVGPGDTERSLRAIELGIVDTFVGTPTFAMHLANVFEGRDINARSFGLRRVVTGGEPGGGLPEIRSRIEKAFNSEVREVMGIGDISPSLYGECEARDGMHFSGQGFVWPELIDADDEQPLAIEPGAFGEMVYTALVRDAMPLIRFRSGDLIHITDTECVCGRTSFKMRCVGRTDDMFIVRGVNVYPSAISDITAEFQPHLTGRARAVLPIDTGVSIEPPVKVEVELRESTTPPEDLADRVASRIRSKLLFRAEVAFVSQDEFGDAGYKTRPVAKRSENVTL